MNDRPYILITNDDGIDSKGIRMLIDSVRPLADVLVVAPAANASGLAHSFTSGRPLRANLVSEEEHCVMMTCDGTPVDCIKLSLEHFCRRKPDVVLSGINHGSNASINVLYSGTMGAVVEASMCGCNAVGFSLLDHSPDADFNPMMPYVRSVVENVLANGLPPNVSLNVNAPVALDGGLKGLLVCRQSKARWDDAYEKRVDPQGRPYYWLTGTFVCDDKGEGTDQWALENGYISVVPVSPDYTDYVEFDTVAKQFHNN